MAFATAGAITTIAPALLRLPSVIPAKAKQPKSGFGTPRSLQGASKMSGKENSTIWARNGSKYTF
jgi:hypothetical protein